MFFEQAREQEEAKWRSNKQDSVVRPAPQPLIFCGIPPSVRLLLNTNELNVGASHRLLQDGEAPC